MIDLYDDLNMEWNNIYGIKQDIEYQKKSILKKLKKLKPINLQNIKWNIILNRKNIRTKKYNNYIRKIYNELSNKELFTIDKESTLLKDDYNIKIKEIIVEYCNPKNYTFQKNVVFSKKRSSQIESDIQDALNVLERYKTSEYYNLLENGFYNYKLNITPIEDEESNNSLDNFETIDKTTRKDYKKYTPKNWLIQEYRSTFIKNLETLDIQKYIAKDIAYLLEKIF